MSFSTDRHLLVLEPGLFHDVPFAGQELLRVSDAQVLGVALSSAAANFQTLGISGGHVVLIDGLALEVIERQDHQTLTVSKLRARVSDPPLPPGDRAQTEAVIRTFAPQAGLVHDTLLRMLGIDPDDPHSALQPEAIVSQGVMGRLEALGTLERVYSGAVALVGDNGVLWRKARSYHQRFTAECRRATVLLDLDGDGRADLRRPLCLAHLVRV